MLSTIGKHSHGFPAQGFPAQDFPAQGAPAQDFPAQEAPAQLPASAIASETSIVSLSVPAVFGASEHAVVTRDKPPAMAIMAVKLWFFITRFYLLYAPAFLNEELHSEFAARDQKVTRSRVTACRAMPNPWNAGVNADRPAKGVFVMKTAYFAFTLAALALPVQAQAAATWTPYSPAKFAGAQQQGKTIIVDVFASWCSICKAQAPTLNRLLVDPRFKDATFVRVDFDKDKAFLKQYRVARQSTVLVFKGKKETARSIAETRPAQLRTAVITGI